MQNITLIAFDRNHCDTFHILFLPLSKRRNNFAVFNEKTSEFYDINESTD
jgi:hypothetical protein